MKRFFNQDSIWVGIVAELGSELLLALLLWGVLTILGIPATEHLRWFGGAFIPGLLVVRYYARKKEYLLTTKTTITVFFLTFIAFVYLIIPTS